MQSINGTQYLTIKETAVRLGISPGHLRNMRSDGRMPIDAERFGASVLYRADDVERLALERASQAA